MPFTRPNLTSPFPRPATPRITAPVRVSGGPGAPLAAVLGGTNFLARIWLSFDPPTAVLPTWIEVTGFVANNVTITINHGRADGLSDVNATTCSLTVDNSDGRWNPGNPNGAWYGLIHKGSWLKVDLLPGSGNLSDRFVGFITALPTAFEGQYASTVVTASDRYGKLTNIPTLLSAIEHEVLTDPNLAGNVKGYWNLHEAVGSPSFGDTSGAGARYLATTALGGVPLGTGFAAANAPGPGFDGLRVPTFNPPSPLQGTYLSGAITSPVGVWNFATTSYTGLMPTIEFWFQATTTGVDQPLICLVDPVGQYALTIFIHSSGFLEYDLLSTAFGNPAGAQTGGLALRGGVNDGAWHHAVMACSFAVNAGTFYYDTTSMVDGGAGSGWTLSSTSSAGGVPGNYGAAFTQLFVGAGYHITGGATVMTAGAANISDVAFYWSDMSKGGKIPNVTDHYAAGATGFLGESTDQRVARIARYAGVPIPLQTASAQVSGNNTTNFTTQIYNPGKGPWTNLSPGAHTCGAQAIAGRSALEVMREAARTEASPLFVDRSGYLALQPSTTRQNTSPAWTVDSRDLEKNTSLPDDFAYVLNQATITPNGQAAQTVVGAIGAASQAKYGIYTQGGQQSTASVSPIEAQSLGYSLIQQRADPPPRLAPVTVEAATLAGQAGYGNAWYDLVLATEISTAMRVTSMPSQAGGGNQDGIVEGWVETISAGQHTFAFSTSPVQGPTYQLDDVVLGRLDTAGSTLASGIGTATTIFQVSTTGSGTGAPTWTTNPADFPFDILVGAEQMTVTSIANLLASDGTFESGVAAWTSAGGSGSSSSAQAHSGTQSCLLTVAGTPASTTLRSSNALVFPNMTYSVTHWMFAAVGTPNVQVTIDWYTSGAAFISSSTSSSVAASAAWTTQTVTALAPPTAGLVRVGATMPGSPATGNGIYIDDVSLSPSALSQLFTVVRSVNGVVSAPAAGTAVNVATPLTLAY